MGGRIDDLPDRIIHCLAGKTFGRKAFEQGIEEGMREEGGFSKARRVCIQRSLRRTVTDDEIVSITERHTPPSIQRKVTRAYLSC